MCASGSLDSVTAPLPDVNCTLKQPYAQNPKPSRRPNKNSVLQSSWAAWKHQTLSLHLHPKQPETKNALIKISAAALNPKPKTSYKPYKLLDYLHANSKSHTLGCNLEGVALQQDFPEAEPMRPEELVGFRVMMFFS